MLTHLAENLIYVPRWQLHVLYEVKISFARRVNSKRALTTFKITELRYHRGLLS